MDRIIAVCTYRVKPDQEIPFQDVIGRHYPTLKRLGLVDDAPHLVLRGRDEADRPVFVELLPWKAEDGPTIAEQTAEVIAIWERMGSMVEPRAGMPPMEFPLFVEVLSTGDAERS